MQKEGKDDTRLQVHGGYSSSSSSCKRRERMTHGSKFTHKHLRGWAQQQLLQQASRCRRQKGFQARRLVTGAQSRGLCRGRSRRSTPCSDPLPLPSTPARHGGKRPVMAKAKSIAIPRSADPQPQSHGSTEELSQTSHCIRVRSMPRSEAGRWRSRLSTSCCTRLSSSIAAGAIAGIAQCPSARRAR